MGNKSSILSKYDIDICYNKYGQAWPRRTYMTQYNMLEAKNNLSKICKMIVNKEEDYIVIASNGKPLVKVVPYKNENSKRKFGTLKGVFKYDDRFDDDNQEIEKLFEGE